MSILTRDIRSAGFGFVLDAIEDVQSAAKTAAANPTPDTVNATVQAAAKASAAASQAVAQAAAPAPTATPLATIAIQDVGGFLAASATSLIASKLGPAASFAEPAVTDLISEFEAWLETKVG
jgi:hypothetical protein